jgi:hypothetical protein
MRFSRLPLFFHAKTAKNSDGTAGVLAVISLAGMPESEDFCGIRGLARCKFLGRTAKNGETPLIQLQPSASDLSFRVCHPPWAQSPAPK